MVQWCYVMGRTTRLQKELLESMRVFAQLSSMPIYRVYFTLGRELPVHSGNGSNVACSIAKGTDPFPECRRAPNLNYTRFTQVYFTIEASSCGAIASESIFGMVHVAWRTIFTILV